jgi:hypothetical protein
MLRGFGSNARNERSVLSLPQAFSSGISALAIRGPVSSTASGACTANVWKNILEVRGGGMAKCVTVSNANGVSKNLALRIVLDGIEVFNQPVASASTLTYVAVGNIVTGTLSSVIDDPLPFFRSLLIQYRSDVTETDGSTIAYRYDIRR